MSTDKQNTSKILFTIFITILIDMIGVCVLFPVLPMLILPTSAFKVIPDGYTLSQAMILSGYLAASFPIMQFIFAPILGQLSDRFGRKKILALSISGTTVAYTICAIGIMTRSLTLLFISRLMGGVAGGNIATAQAVIADISSPESRAKNFGLIGMAFGLGFILGPAIGGKLSDPHTISWFGAATPFYFTSVMSAINVLIVIKFLPETLAVAKKARIKITQPLHNIKNAFMREGLRNIMPSTFLFNCGFTFFTSFFTITLAHKYGFTQGDIGNFFAYLGLMIVLSQAILVRRMSRVCNDYKVLRYSMFGTAASLLTFYLIPASHPGLLYLVPPFMAACNAMTNSFNASLVTRIAPTNIRGENLGINSSVMAIAQAIPAILAGYVASVEPVLPILTGACVAACGGIIFWILFKPERFPMK